WTYADLNSVFLGQVNSSGEVLIPSFHRDWTGIGSLDVAANPFTWRPFDANEKDPTKFPPPWKKYATLRPLPWYNRGDPAKFIGGVATGGFPPPADGGGDVKNLDGGLGVKKGAGGHYNNDSIWIDLGFPVLTGPNGRMYKALFAPLIIDLDGKVNLNVAGNLRGTVGGTPLHASNHGYYPSEINLSAVVPNPLDWRNILRYRYGTDSLPANGGVFSGSGIAPPFYAWYDFDAVKSDHSLSERIYLPGDKAGNKYLADGHMVPFPYIPPASYGGGSVAERTNHPAMFNYFNTALSGDKLFRLHQLETMYRYRGTGSPMLGGDLFNLANLPQQSFASTATRWNTTLLSMDLSRPGLMPWLDDPTAGDYLLSEALGTPIAMPRNRAAVPGPSPNRGEYGADYRGWAGLDLVAKRLNINRKLTDYPQPSAATGQIDLSVKANVAQLNQAQQDRQQLCQDIFDLLRYVTTGARPGWDPVNKVYATPLPPPGSPQYNALRWLAQLAANLVDLRDVDNIATVFLWDEANGQYVFGTELPKLLINEVYAEVVNDPMDPGVKMMKAATKDYHVNFWIELINPMLRVNDPFTGTQNDVLLQTLDAKGNPERWPVYKITILGPDVDDSVALTKDFLNVRGDPTPPAIKLEVADFVPDPKSGVKFDPALHFRVQALDQNMIAKDGSNDGFYVLGPQVGFPTTNPKGALTPTLNVNVQIINGVRSALTYEDLPRAWFDTNAAPPKHTILLRRLANPFLPYQDNPKLANYNPYITVDYVQNVPANDAVEFDHNGAHAGRLKEEERRSFGRRQPYVATAWSAQAPDTDTTKMGVQPYLDRPQHTFFAHNAQVLPAAPGDATLKVPFDWLAFLDRNFASPIEMLLVSAYRPHDLTQKFGLGGGHAHLAPWTHSNSRIYRFLELVDAGHRMQGISQDGVFPGKININTIWDADVFRALCDQLNVAGVDQNQAVKFHSGDVTAIYNNLITSRSPGGVPGPADRPFQSLSAADTNAPNQGVEATILRSFGPNRLMIPPSAAGGHPVHQGELLSKIFNNLTTRSNVFAVWVTVGFFEVFEWPVVDAKGNLIGTRLELGQEVGRAENRHVRHRMFAIVDRTGLY
ncbi:MAG: hypothetical protein NZO58_11135, partial [Gemmataceae bacterium]|nr:hypothetical protein [Gemmataceae bacterium]